MLFFVLHFMAHKALCNVKKIQRNFPKCILSYNVYDGALPCHVFYLCFSSTMRVGLMIHRATTQKIISIYVCNMPTTQRDVAISAGSVLSFFFV